jgi:uncharacterized protein (DUF305 family)
MQKSTYIIAGVIVALVFGLGIGYQVGGHRGWEKDGSSEKGYGEARDSQYGQGGHMMADGSMMDNADSMSMADMMSGMNAALKGKTGDEFDRAFISEMIVHHQGAVEMAQLALTNAKHQEIKTLAQAIIAAQNKEIADMKTWQKNWFGQ